MTIALHTRVVALLPVLLLSVLLTGCGSPGPRVAQEPWAPVPPMVLPPVEQSSGSIYAAGRDVRLFEDLRAHRIGDILTVSLEERTNARKSSSTSTAKSSDFSVSNPVLGGRTVSSNGIPILENSIDSSHGFSGEGDSSQSNSLDGNITVTVAAVLPNGNLVIRGEKWLTINQGDEFVRLSGIIRPHDIGTDNMVESSKIADARISYSGKGPVAASNKMGWLARFFNSGWMPY